MTTLNISTIKQYSRALGELAEEIDNSNVSKKDGNIDDKEFGIFKERAKTELLDKKLISDDNYKAIFGLEKQTTPTKVNTDSLTYTRALNNIDNKEKKISELKEKIRILKNHLYGEELANKQTFGEAKKDILNNVKDFSIKSAIGSTLLVSSTAVIGSMMGLAVKAGVVLGSIAGLTALGAATALIAGGICIGGKALLSKLDQNEKENCEKNKPELYEALQAAERELNSLTGNN